METRGVSYQASAASSYKKEATPSPGSKLSDNSKGTSEEDPAYKVSIGTAKSEDDPRTKAKIEQLKATEQRVKAHEAAHKAVAGQYAGPVNYQYTRGPDGKMYITGGEVPINVSAESDPEATIRKMEIVKAAALAPADPSGQDRAVAAQAQQIKMQAQQQLAEEKNKSSAQEGFPVTTIDVFA